MVSRAIPISLRRLAGVAGLLATFGPAHAIAADRAASLAKTAVCAACHGAAGISPMATYPNLAGQNASYIEYALGEFRNGQRQGEQADIMAGIAKTLSTEDIPVLAAYYASLK